MASAATWRRNGRHRGELLAWSGNAREGHDMDVYVVAPSDPHFVRRFKLRFPAISFHRLFARQLLTSIWASNCSH